MIATFLKYITVLPALLSSIKELLVWVTDQMNEARKRRASEALAKAIDLAQKEKDTSRMDKTFDSRNP